MSAEEERRPPAGDRGVSVVERYLPGGVPVLIGAADSGIAARDQEIVMSMLIARAGATRLLDLRSSAVALATVAVFGTPW